MGSAALVRQTVNFFGGMRNPRAAANTGVSSQGPFFENLGDNRAPVALPEEGECTLLPKIAVLNWRTGSPRRAHLPRVSLGTAVSDRLLACRGNRDSTAETTGASNNDRDRHERGRTVNPRLLAAALACCGAWPAFAQSALVADDLPVMLADSSGTVTVAIALRNTGSQPLAVHLSTMDFEHQPATGAPYPLGATSTFSATSEADKAVLNGVPLAPGGVLNAKLTVSKLWEAGESTAVMQNNDEDIRTRNGAPRTLLREVHIPAAFNVRIDAGPTDPPEIRFSSLGSGGGKLLVRLVNSDPMSYRFRWSLRLGND